MVAKRSEGEVLYIAGAKWRFAVPIAVSVLWAAGRRMPPAGFQRVGYREAMLHIVSQPAVARL